MYYTDESYNKVCLSSSICDDNHPILDKKTNECFNYRVKYGNEYLYECPKNTCISQRFENSRICEDKTSDMKIFNGICFNDYSSLKTNFKEMAKNNIKMNEYEGITLIVYSSNDYSKNFDKLLQNNINTTLIDIRECLSLYKEQNNLGEETDIYIVVVDTPSVYSNETVNRFDFELYLDNMTKINNLDVCKDVKMKVYSPITNAALINLELGNYFYEQGDYNIFNKNDKFYKDVCSGANMDDNDITLNDRYIDIYPHEIQTCPKGCECLGINYTINTFICDCDIKLNIEENNNNYEYELTNTEDIVNYFKDFNNLAEFFLDMINYKIIKCYELLTNLNNYKYNTGFYIGAGSFLISFVLLLLFRINGFQSIRKFFSDNLRNIIIERNKIFQTKINENEDKKIINKKLKENKKGNRKNKNEDKIHYKKTNNYKKGRTKRLTSKGYNKTTDYDDYNSLKTLNNDKDNNTNNKNDKSKEKTNEDEETKNNDDYNVDEAKEINMSNKEINELSYFEAKNIDNRHFFTIFFSIFFIKIELIKNFCYPEDYSNRCLLFNLYILDSYIDLLMNCLLYNDYAISQKYHCNGQLEFVTSIIMSLLSNIFTFIIISLIQYLTNFPAIVEIIIKEIKNIKEYFSIIIKLLRVMKHKFAFLLIVEIILGLFMVYYISIFSIINSKSINSFLLNYLIGELESLIYSFGLSFIIALIRKISLSCKSKRMYIVSLYFNEHF